MKGKLNFYRNGVSISLSGDLDEKETALASDVIEDLLTGLSTFKKFRGEPVEEEPK